jgi:hypothetical protein
VEEAARPGQQGGGRNRPVCSSSPASQAHYVPSPMSPDRITVWARARAHSKLPRHFAVACVIALAAFIVPSGATASTKSSDAPQLAAIHTLSGSRYKAIERVLIAGLPLDTVSEAKYGAALDAMLRACGKLSRQDPLLRAMRAGCPAMSEFAEAMGAMDVCWDTECFEREIKSARAALRRVIGGSRMSDRAIKATRLAAGCKRALVTPPGGYASSTKLYAGLGKLQHAVATGSDDDFAAAEAALARAEETEDRLPTNRRLLQMFRSGCR